MSDFVEEEEEIAPVVYTTNYQLSDDDDGSDEEGNKVQLSTTDVEVGVEAVEDPVDLPDSPVKAGTKRKALSDEAVAQSSESAAAASESPNAAQRPRSDNHTKVVATHYNELEEKGLAERSKSRIFHMRNFNNWIKSALINEYLTKVKQTLKLGEPLRVLDMCCGKGGDLLKWEKSGITHLICTDIAEVSIQQCEERYNTMAERAGRNKFGKLFSAEFFACDSTLQRLREHYKDPSIELNVVSCQFAFHYCFESLKQAECMIQNAAECLRPGGYFIGTIPDANDIMKRQRQAQSNEFGNDIYRISFLCDTETPPLFGAKYNFELDGVVNCPEFLVYFPLLVKLAAKFGLRLVFKERFDEYFERHRQTCKCDF